jgi:hypothetical protein
MIRLTLLSLLILLSGCITSEVITVEVPVRVPIVCDKTAIPSIETYPVVWQLGRNEDGKNILGLDGENYSNLSINIGRSISHIEARRRYSDYLEECMDSFNSTQ